MSKRFKNIVKEVTARWKETILSTAEPDVGKAVEMLKKVKAGMKAPQIFTVKSPVEFYIAQAVLRGRVSKKNAVAMAESPGIGIDSSFVKPLTRLGAPRRLTQRSSRWGSPSATTNIATAVLEKQFHDACADYSAGPPTVSDSRVRIALQSLPNLYRMFLPHITRLDANGNAEQIREAEHRDWRLNFNSAQTHIEDSVWTIADAVSSKPDDILNDQHIPNWHKYDAVQAEIISKAIGCKNPAIIWPYEIFHYVPAVMQFDNAFLILAGKPKIHYNADDEMHNNAGPAVEWPDGKKFWYIDDHYLSSPAAERIVLSPETLTKDDIVAIQNEEERRVAIDRMGWNKYLTAIEAKISDSRENWVDNTYEVLIVPPVDTSVEKWRRRNEPQRMVLSCRSTGRKYFIAVPETRDGDEPIKNCADAQLWLADGATTEHLDYAKHPLNVIGAS